MKKTLVCILAMAFLFPLGSHAEGFLNFFFGTPSSGMTLQYIPAQEEAFFTLDGHQEARLLGASGDGKINPPMHGSPSPLCVRKTRKP